MRHRLLVVPTVGIESNLSIVANSKNYRASRLLIRGESSPCELKTEEVGDGRVGARAITKERKETFDERSIASSVSR